MKLEQFKSVLSPGKSSFSHRTGPFSVLGILIVLATSCVGSKELSRSRALALLKDSKDFRSPAALLLTTDHGSPIEALSLDEPASEAQTRIIARYLKDHPQAAVFHYLGLVEVRATVVQTPEADYLWWKFDVEPALTEKGRELAAKEHAPDQSVPIARKEVVEVTGIRKISEGSVEAEFTWKEDPTEAGEVFDPQSAAYRSLPKTLQEEIRQPRGIMGRDATRKYGEVYTATASFQLYDDGWRLQLIRYGPLNISPQ
jgi:hypothetical protein